MATRLLRAGHRVVAYDRTESVAQRMSEVGAMPATTLEALVQALDPPRAVWIMVPAGEPTEAMILALAPLLGHGDTILDGGNSNYHDSQRHARELHGRGIAFVDVGTSGGVWGLTEGYSLMIGGEAAPVERLRPIFESLAPAPDRGWGHVGPPGSGHFVKMVHNGIEYGMMQAFAEGFAILERKQELALDLAQVAGIWRNGSVVRSWLLDLLARALEANPAMNDVAPYVDDSGEGRWTVAEAIDLDVPAPVITQSLIQRLRSRDERSYADRLLASLRNQFGGHAIHHDAEGGAGRAS